MSQAEFNGMFLAAAAAFITLLIAIVTIAIKINTILNEISYTNKSVVNLIEDLTTRVGAVEKAQRLQEMLYLKNHPEAMQEYISGIKRE